MERLLIVDDDSQVRKVLRLFLERHGYTVLEAENGLKAIELCKSNVFDLIIVDMYMPEKDGVSFIYELREFSPDVRVIAISGGEKGYYFTSDTKLDVALSVGAIRTLRKPFPLEELLTVVKELLHQKPAAPERDSTNEGDKKTPPTSVERQTPSLNMPKTINTTFSARQDQLFKVSLAIAALAGKSDGKQVSFNLTATSEKGFDPAWIRKEFGKMLGEAGIDKIIFE